MIDIGATTWLVVLVVTAAERTLFIIVHHTLVVIPILPVRVLLCLTDVLLFVLVLVMTPILVVFVVVVVVTILLVIIIPKSISEFIGKQFEVITLITLRSFFHDIADLDLIRAIDINNPFFVRLLYDLAAAIIMLGFTILYYRIYQKNSVTEQTSELTNFIGIKKLVSLGMILVLLLLSIISLYQWGSQMIDALRINSNYPNPNTVFYIDFFSIMIFVG